MPLDLRSIGDGQKKPLLDPRDIYSALPSRPWPYLRHEQGEVLEGWFKRRADSDLVIKQNTGGGKTAVGLLIALSTLNEGVGRALYIAPDNYLAAQARREATRLGIMTATEPRDSDFRARKAVLVTTLAKLINGRSQFGVLDSGREVIDLGIVVIDDAHAALAAAENQFKLSIPRRHPAYGKLWDLFASDLSDQSVKRWTDIREGDTTAVLRVPFWSWSDKQSKVMAALHPHREDDDFQWTWPLMAEVLQLCSVTVTYDRIEIKPPCLPINRIPSFQRAKRRVYLTATLADDSVLITDLDANPTYVREPVTPGRASDLGDRMILAPVALNPSLDELAVMQMARQYADGDRDGDGRIDAESINVVVLVPSNNAAKKWAGVADSVHHVGDLEAGVDQLKTRKGRVVVLVNKYDGVDLPQDACRMLIIDGVPRPLDGAERRESAALAGSDAFLARQVQRIEQGMGRGVRDTEDYCVVLLLGADLALTLTDPTHAALLSPATRAQVQLSSQIADQIDGEGLAALRDAIGYCLTRDEEWKKLGRRALAEVEYEKTSTIRPEAVAQRRAFDAAEVGQFQQAVDLLQQVINTIDDKYLRGWLTEQLATYLHEVDPTRAQKALATANIDNPAILRPAAGVPVHTLKAAAAQGEAASQFLTVTYNDGPSLVLGVRALLDRVDWDEARTDEAEAAWELLGKHLGFASDRPEKLYKTGPDNLWLLDQSLHAAFELKTGTKLTADSISKSDVDQLGGSARWVKDEYGSEVSVVPVSVHPVDRCSNLATPPDGMRVITPGKLDDLKRAVRDYATVLAQGTRRWEHPQTVTGELSRLKLNGRNLIQAFTLRAKS